MSDAAEQAAAEQALEDAVERGWMERVGVDDQGQQLYRLTGAGYEAVEAGFAAGEEILRARQPAAAEPGMVAIHRDGDAVVLLGRKDDDSGWGLVGGGGLADSALSGDDWRLLDRRRVQLLFRAGS
jgi:hypothetical protein